MTEEGKYIYCIIGETKETNFGLPRRLRRHVGIFRGYTGINNQEVSLVYYKDIAAAVSTTPIINFDRLDKKELVKNVTVHQKVNEIVMKDYDVVPMAFGIIAPNLNEVMRILEKAYLQFKTALKNVTAKAEFVVQVWWNPKKILEELANNNIEIQKLKQEPSSLGKLIAQKMEDKRQTFTNDIQTFLKNLSYDFTSNMLIDDEMIANFSFLIEKAKESELDKKMQELGKKYEGKLRFKYIGPMPPYSFVNINLGLGNFEVVDEARKLLGLGEEAAFDEIKKAYYTLTHQYHPHKFQGKEEQMKKTIQAYSILENYCQSCSKLTNPERSRTGQKYSFKKENVENSIIIK